MSGPADAAAAARQVLGVLELAARPPAEGTDRFSGISPDSSRDRIFGGQVLAQSLLAAMRTVDAGRLVHSLHAYFLRPGDPARPIEFEVERLRDGGSFSARRTQAVQRDLPILSMISSFQLPAEGLDHQFPMPQVAPPEELADPYREPDDRAPFSARLLRSLPVELRPVPDLASRAGPEPAARQAVWMRVAGRLPDDPLLHTAMLAYVSDYTLLEVAIRAHGLSFAMPGIKAASLDHAMWFHRPARADEWFLYVQDSPSASGARGLSTGRIYTRDGALVASVAQEGMIRVITRPAAGSRPEAVSPG